MESIKELRHQLQEEKMHPAGWVRPWGYKTFQRGPSIYITQLLIRTKITPTQVTIAGFFLGLVGCGFLYAFDAQIKLLGLFLLYLHILSDKVDGEIARYRKTYSLKGIFWDEINHLVVPPLAWISLTFGIARIPTLFDIRGLFIAGILGALALVIIRVTHSLAPQIYAKKYLKHPEYFLLPPKQTIDIEAPQSLSITKKIGRVLHQFQHFFIIIVCAALVLLYEMQFRNDEIFHPILSGYIVIMSGLFILFAIEAVIKKSRSVESDIKHITQLEK